MKTVLNNTTAITMSASQVQKLKFITLKRSLKLISTLIIIILSNTNCKTKFYAPTICTYDYIPKPVSLQYNTASINGNVVDMDGNKIQGAQVYFDNDSIGITNSEGFLSYSASKRIDKNYTISFTKDGFNNCSKSYHTNMGEANYLVTMTKPCICDSIVDNNCFAKYGVLEFDFEEHAAMLHKVQKKILDDYIWCLKSNPDVTITIQYNLQDANKQEAINRLELVKKYFVNTGGISESRIKKYVETKPTVDAKQISITKNFQERNYE